MGNQQILLLIIGTIIVAVAVTVGIMEVRGYYTDSIGDEMATTILEQAQEAKTYFLKPQALGGGNKTFIGFTLPMHLGKIEGIEYILSTGGVHNKLLITGKAREGMCNASIETPDGTHFFIAWMWTGEFLRRNTPSTRNKSPF